MDTPSTSKAGLPTKSSLPLDLDKLNSLDQNTALTTALQALNIMGGPTWKIEERRDLLRMRTNYDLTDEQVHDLIGRIYGETWRNSDPQRKKYTIKDIRDGEFFKVVSISSLQTDILCQQRSVLVGRLATVMATTRSLILRMVTTMPMRRTSVHSRISVFVTLHSRLAARTGCARMDKGHWQRQTCQHLYAQAQRHTVGIQRPSMLLLLLSRHTRREVEQCSQRPLQEVRIRLPLAVLAELLQHELRPLRLSLHRRSLHLGQADYPPLGTQQHRYRRVKLSSRQWSQRRPLPPALDVILLCVPPRSSKWFTAKTWTSKKTDWHCRLIESSRQSTSPWQFTSTAVSSSTSGIRVVNASMI